MWQSSVHNDVEVLNFKQNFSLSNYKTLCDLLCGSSRHFANYRITAKPTKQLV